MRRIIRHFYYLTAKIFLGIVQLLPYKTAVRCGGWLGLAAYHLIGQARDIAKSNLYGAFPEKSTAEIERMAKRVFINQGKNAFELLSFPKLKKDKIEQLVTIENKSKLFEPIRSGKGIVMASAHCGNWEMMGASFAQLGLPVNVIARRIYIEGLNSLLVRLRERQGMKVILRSGRDAAKLMLKALKQHEIIALLIDQDTDVPGVFVEFFSKEAWTPSGLATLALKTDAAVVLALDVRTPEDHHRAVITPLEMTRTGDMEKDVRENTQMITRLIEAHIRRYPDQWVWMHRRWKTRPQYT